MLSAGLPSQSGTSAYSVVAKFSGMQPEELPTQIAALVSGGSRVDSRKGTVPKERDSLPSSKEKGEATDCVQDSKCCVGQLGGTKPLRFISQVEDDDHMAAEAATLHPGSRCEVNPGGKRGVIRQEHCAHVVT